VYRYAGGPTNLGDLWRTLAANELTKTQPRSVRFGQLVHNVRRETLSAKGPAERALRQSSAKDRADDPRQQAQEQSPDEECDSDAAKNALQSSSFSLPMKLPMLIPLPPMSSRRLIMYPLAMSIASSEGIPASMSFL